MEGSQNGPGGVSGNNGKTRAQIFEDEKQRIIETCFGKKDESDSCRLIPARMRTEQSWR
jgi:hypothetical protein